ncbi:fimbrial biogenesis chaperone [Spirosoma gilvum]
MVRQICFRFGRASSLCICLCLTAIVCQAQTGFQVSPAKIYFSAKESGDQTARIHLNNTMNVRLVLQATCADWLRDSTGSKVYYRPGSLPTSCCSFFTVTPSTIELAPGEERDVLVTMQANPQLTSGKIRNGMLLLTQANEREVAQAKASQFIIKVEIGVHVYLLPGETSPPDIAITGMNVIKAENQFLVKVQVENKGGTLLESQLRMEYLNTETMEEIKADPIPVNTMPKDAFNVVTAIPPKLTEGKYLIVAILDSGPNQALKVAELEAILK